MSSSFAVMSLSPAVQLRGGASSLMATPRRATTTARRGAAGNVVRVNAASKYSLVATGTNLPHPDKVKKGGEDAWFVRINSSGGGEMYLADGVGGFNEQGVDPGLYARVLTYEAAKAKASMARNPLSRPDPKKARGKSVPSHFPFPFQSRSFNRRCSTRGLFTEKGVCHVRGDFAATVRRRVAGRGGLEAHTDECVRRII